MVPASGGRAGARAAGRHANPTATIPDASGPRTVALSDLMPKIVRVNLFRRHPIALGLIALVLVSALAPLPALVDAVSGAPPPDADLIRPALYTLFAPASDVLDALTFLSLERARAFLLVWVSGIALWGVTRPGSVTRRLLRAGATGLAFPLLGVAGLVLPRPAPRTRRSRASMNTRRPLAHATAVPAGPSRTSRAGTRRRGSRRPMSPITTSSSTERSTTPSGSCPGSNGASTDSTSSRSAR